ncbi:MAG TPA: hypothetical protein VNJ12_03260 [Candidatus Dormibacteraeota bacterium]|nr:hypothetical protein [Candidatus Dormibacteraeota bacterium]
MDPYWPKPLPDHWEPGQLGGVCIDSQNHVFVVNRRNLTKKQLLAADQAPPIIEFDSAGNVINSFGDPKVVPNGIHGCTTDAQGNLYVGGMKDGIIQKYSPKGKLLLQIGTRGVVDTSTGNLEAQAGGHGFMGRAMNSSHDSFFLPAAIAIDPTNGDIYVADGYGNTRVAVFNKEGHFLRQWGRQGSLAEEKAGVGGVFAQVVHCVTIGNDGLVYVCDRQGDRIEVFNKQGHFEKNIFLYTWINGPKGLPDQWGTAWWIGFSPDPAQKYMYVADGRNEQVHILDHATGQILASFGRGGHQVGEFTHCHTMAVDSKGNIYVAETGNGERVQKFTFVGYRTEEVPADAAKSSNEK